LVAAADDDADLSVVGALEGQPLVTAGEERAEAVVEADDGGLDLAGLHVGGAEVAVNVLDQVKECEGCEVGDDESLADVEGHTAILDGVDEAEGLPGGALQVGKRLFELADGFIFEEFVGLVHAGCPGLSLS